MTGTFKFTWGHPAEEVYVTGTFDNWTKSEKLDKVGDKFEKDVTLADSSKKIYYKFVVDNNWITDHTAPQEPDHEGNVNNFLTPEQIVKGEPTVATMSTVTPESTTAALAAGVPLEKKDDEPKATPTGGPGGFPATPADELDKTVSVNPLPATDVTKPSTTLAPGEPIPPEAKSGDINAGVTLDKESYEKSDRLPGLTDDNTKLPEATGQTIPESSLPATSIGAAALNSLTPESTTAALAADVPKEPAKVPEVVKESQEKADAAPEASSDPKEVQEKAAVEEELKEKVPEAPSTSEGTSGFGTTKSESAGIAATAATAGSIALAAAVAAKDAIIGKSEPAATQATETVTQKANEATVAATSAATQLPDSVKEQLPVAAQDAIKAQAQEETRQEVAPNVPTEVKESLTEAAKAPEAASNSAAVEDKKEVEAELLKEVKPVPAVGDEPSKAEEVKEEAKAAVKDEPKETPKEALAESSKKEANGSTATDTKTETSTTGDKKKHRISAFFGKIKNKVSSKN